MIGAYNTSSRSPKSNRDDRSRERGSKAETETEVNFVPSVLQQQQDDGSGIVSFEHKQLQEQQAILIDRLSALNTIAAQSWCPGAPFSQSNVCDCCCRLYIWTFICLLFLAQVRPKASVMLCSHTANWVETRTRSWEGGGAGRRGSTWTRAFYLVVLRASWSRTPSRSFWRSGYV